MLDKMRKIQIRITAVEGENLLMETCETVEVAPTNEEFPFPGYQARKSNGNGSVIAGSAVGACVMAVLREDDI